MATWRKGLRWDKAKAGWVNVKTGRKLGVRTLKRRKVKLPVVPRVPKVPKVPKPPKRPPKPKLPKGWRKGLKWNKKKRRWIEVRRRFDKTTKKWRKIERALTHRQVELKIEFARIEQSIKKIKDKRAAVFETLEVTLEQAVQGLIADGYVANKRVHPNVDGTIDGELRVKPKRGQEVRTILTRMEHYFIPVPGTWVSSGVRYYPREDERYYSRFKGMSQAQAYFSEAPMTYINFATGKEIDTQMRKRGRKKAEQVFIRVHWNPANERPDTPEQRERQKVRKKKGGK